MMASDAAFHRGVSAGMHGVTELVMRDILALAGDELNRAGGDKTKAFDRLVAELRISHSIREKHMKSKFTAAERKAVRDARDGS